MQFEWDGKVGPASIICLAQMVGIFIGGAVVWTQLSDKVSNTSEKLDSVRTTVSALRTDLKSSQDERAQQSERLGRVETAVTFISSYIKLGVNQFDGVAPFPPHGPPSAHTPPAGPAPN